MNKSYYYLFLVINACITLQGMDNGYQQLGQSVDELEKAKKHESHLQSLATQQELVSSGEHKYLKRDAGNCIEILRLLREFAVLHETTLSIIIAAINTASSQSRIFWQPWNIEDTNTNPVDYLYTTLASLLEKEAIKIRPAHSALSDKCVLVELLDDTVSKPYKSYLSTSLEAIEATSFMSTDLRSLAKLKANLGTTSAHIESIKKYFKTIQNAQEFFLKESKK